MINLIDPIQTILAGIQGDENKYIPRWLTNYIHSGTNLGKFLSSLILSSTSIQSRPDLIVDFMHIYLESSFFVRAYFKSYIQYGRHRNSFESAIEICKILKRCGVLDETNLTLVGGRESPLNLCNAIAMLHSNSLLTQDNINILARRSYETEYADTLIDLKNNKITLSDDQKLILDTSHPSWAICVFANIYRQGIVIPPELRARFSNQQFFHGFYASLYKVIELNYLSKKTFAQLIAPEHTALLTEWSYYNVWCDLSESDVKYHWENILQRSRLQNPSEALVKLIQRIKAGDYIPTLGQMSALGGSIARRSDSIECRDSSSPMVFFAQPTISGNVPVSEPDTLRLLTS